MVRKGTEIEFAGEQHFSYHEKDGNASNQFAFIMIILFEIPLAHLLLHFVWSPLGALIITIITAYGLLWMIGNYRATIKRPISISNESLYVRYGLLGNTKVNLRSIENAQMVGGRVRRRKEIVRHVAAGSANVKLELKKSTSLKNVLGIEQNIEAVYLAVDSPRPFIEALKDAIAKAQW